MDNAWIADRLDAFATLLELAEANPYQPRAYRRASETIRAAPVPIEPLVRSGRVRELRGIGPGSRNGCASWSRPARSPSCASSSATSCPGSSRMGRFLGLTTKRSIEIARALGVRTPDEFREAVAAGRLRSVPGVGPKIEARVREALTREATTQPGLLLDRARSLVGAIASALDGEVAGDTRRWRDACEHLAVVCADPAALARFEALPQIVAVIERDGRHARGLTIEGVPVELVVAAPERFGTELVRATGSAAYVAALEPLPDAPTRGGRVYEALGLPWVPPELREAPFRGEPPVLLEQRDIRGDLHCHTTWSDGRFSVEEMGRAALERGYDYVAICDHTPAVGAVRGLTADDVRRQGEEIAAANERLAPFRILRGIECDILPDGRLDLPDDVLDELDWVQASVHGGQRMPREQMTRRVVDGARAPGRALPQPPEGPDHRPPAGERARPRARVRGRAAPRRRARGQRPHPAPGPQRRARPRGARARACRSSARPTHTPSRGLANMDVRRPHRPPRGRDARGRPQHPPARRPARAIAAVVLRGGPVYRDGRTLLRACAIEVRPASMQALAARATPRRSPLVADHPGGV